jgi:hypothetical protein
MIVTIELTSDQLLKAIRQLPFEERLALLQTLLREDKAEISRRFDRALADVHEANRGLDEDAVIAEVNEIVHQVRAERYAENRR